MGSYDDVKALFTLVPVDLAISTVKKTNYNRIPYLLIGPPSSSNT